MPDKIEFKIGDIAPEFCLLDKDKKKVCLKEFLGKNVILYFYPADNTPGCTTEAIGFTEILPELEKLDATVIGVSPDSPESHGKFIEKKKLKVTLLSDEEKIVLTKYGVWGLKKFKGNTYQGVIRSTFLINAEGKIAFIWPKVSVNGHAEEVKSKLVELTA
jgi:peroxiredoxin Q/BCP